MSDDEIVYVLRESEHWKSKSSLAIAQHFGVSPARVRRLREEFNLIPKTFETSDGRIKRKGLTGKRQGVSLTPREQAMVTEMSPHAEKVAKWKSNKILDYEILLGIANDALILAVKCWDPTKQVGAERKPGSKWRAYAASGINISFCRAFAREKKRLKRNSLTGKTEYQKSIIDKRIKKGFVEMDEQKQGGRKSVDESRFEAVTPEPEGILSRFQEIEGRDRIILEAIGGLDGREPWESEELAVFFDVNTIEAERMIEAAKLSLME